MLPGLGPRTCIVSFRDHSDVVHSAEVSAETLFEAVALGVKAISQQWAEQPALMTKIEVRVTTPTVTHEVTLKQLLDWINGTCTSPRDRLLKDRVKELLPV